MRGMWQKKGFAPLAEGPRLRHGAAAPRPGSHTRLGCKRQLRGHPAQPNPSPQLKAWLYVQSGATAAQPQTVEQHPWDGMLHTSGLGAGREGGGSLGSHQGVTALPSQGCWAPSKSCCDPASDIIPIVSL